MQIVPRRMTARIEGEFVVFLIGARLNQWWRLNDFKWVGDAMKSMVAELETKPESGFLGYESWFGRSPLLVQYWRSSQHLLAYARDKNQVHYPVWIRFNKELSKRRSIGIWHETYVVKPGNYECVYNNMPPFGLARATSTIPAQGEHSSAAGRLGMSDGTDAPIDDEGLERV